MTQEGSKSTKSGFLKKDNEEGTRGSWGAVSVFQRGAGVGEVSFRGRGKKNG